LQQDDTLDNEFEDIDQYFGEQTDVSTTDVSMYDSTLSTPAGIVGSQSPQPKPKSPRELFICRRDLHQHRHKGSGRQVSRRNVDLTLNIGFQGSRESNNALLETLQKSPRKKLTSILYKTALRLFGFQKDLSTQCFNVTAQTLLNRRCTQFEVDGFDDMYESIFLAIENKDHDDFLLNKIVKTRDKEWIGHFPVPYRLFLLDTRSFLKDTLTSSDREVVNDMIQSFGELYAEVASKLHEATTHVFDPEGSDDDDNICLSQEFIDDTDQKFKEISNMYWNLSIFQHNHASTSEATTPFTPSSPYEAQETQETQEAYETINKNLFPGARTPQPVQCSRKRQFVTTNTNTNTDKTPLAPPHKRLAMGMEVSQACKNNSRRDDFLDDGSRDDSDDSNNSGDSGDRDDSNNSGGSDNSGDSGECYNNSCHDYDHFDDDDDHHVDDDEYFDDDASAQSVDDQIHQDCHQPLSESMPEMPTNSTSDAISQNEDNEDNENNNSQHEDNDNSQHDENTNDDANEDHVYFTWRRTSLTTIQMQKMIDYYFYEMKGHGGKRLKDETTRSSRGGCKQFLDLFSAKNQQKNEMQNDLSRIERKWKDFAFFYFTKYQDKRKIFKKVLRIIFGFDINSNPQQKDNHRRCTNNLYFSLLKEFIKKYDESNADLKTDVVHHYLFWIRYIIRYSKLPSLKLSIEEQYRSLKGSRKTILQRVCTIVGTCNTNEGTTSPIYYPERVPISVILSLRPMIMLKDNVSEALKENKIQTIRDTIRSHKSHLQNTRSQIHQTA
tara:strand:- start:76 stop:2409 length:2334 start_codon:yes stop_codon:yes gene_type:complete